MATRDIFKNLLDKSGSGFNVGELLGTYFSSTGKRNNRMRNILGLTTLFGLKEDSMRSNALKNLKENERLKVFDQAKVTNKWNAYDTLMKEDELYRKNPKHFMIQGEAEFAKLNPNFDLSTEDARKKRAKEIKDWALNAKTLHESKIQNPAFESMDKRMTKEEFFKPFEDYYVSRQQAITAPKELSIVHKAWDYLGGKKKDELSPQQIEANKNKALRGSFGFLLDPTEVKGEAEIELFRDPNEFTLTKLEAQSKIIETVKDADLQRSLIRSLNKDNYTPNELKSAMIVGSTNFDPILEKVSQAQTTFDTLWKQENKTVPVIDDDNYNSYILRRTNYVEERSGLGDKDTIELRKKIYLLEDLKNKGVNKKDPVRKALEAEIKVAGIDKVTLTLFNTVLAELSDPLTSAYLEREGIKSEVYAQDKLNEFLNIYSTIFE
jgi:hypothetical protein